MGWKGESEMSGKVSKAFLMYASPRFWKRTAVLILTEFWVKSGQKSQIG